MPFLIRSADFKDRDGLLKLARYFPLCTLPANKSKLENKIQISRDSFAKKLPKEYRNYIFVLEDQKEKKIIGSSQILSYFGENRSLCYALKKEKGKSCLNIKKVQAGKHQIGGLILHPDYRKSKELLGLQIGAVRFLYIKTFPDDFSSRIEVSLTAPVQGKENLFWKETGLKYLKMNYPSALKSFQKDRRHFFSLFPDNLKIDLEDLSPSARSYMEQVHPQTVPVYKGLLKKGFYETRHYHVLDGGIYLEALWKELPFMKNTKRGALKKEKAESGINLILSQSVKNDFYCVQTTGCIKNGKWLVSKFPKEFKEGKTAWASPFPF